MRHILLGLTVPTSLWSTGRAHQLLIPTIQGNISAASSLQAAASDFRREGTTLGLCSQRSQDKVGPTLKEAPTRGTDTRSRLVLHSHTCSQAPDVHPPSPPMNHCIQMWELLPALLGLEMPKTELWRKEPPGSYCLTATGRPTKTLHSSTSIMGDRHRLAAA